MFKLIIEDDEGKTTVVPLIRDEITIGRKEGNTIRLTERNVSRRHAKLIRANGAVYIEDLESYNGIKVNGSKISGKVPIREGDRIEIGDYHLALKLEKAGEAGQPVPAALNEQETQQLRLEEQATVRLVQPPGGPPPVPGEATQPPAGARPAMASDGQQPLGVPQAPPTPARLVVVSQQLGGAEQKLDKAAMVIGRTDENDIVLNHRSISRHHAKILYEGGHYQIVDLGSSNGVRVNGEEYGKVELCRGDIIELGHVRLRFVEAGEEYRFDPATAIDTTASSSRSGLVVVVMVLLLVGIAGGMAWRRGLFGGGTAGVTPQVDAGIGAPIVTAADTGGAANPTVIKPADAGEPVQPAAELEGMLGEANKSAAGRDWSKAISLYDKVLEKSPEHPTAKKLRQVAEEEKQNATTFDKLGKAADRKEWDQALTLFESLGNQSVYRTDASPLMDKVRDGYVGRHKDLAQKALKDKKLEVARAEAELILKLAPENADAKAILAKVDAPERRAPVVVAPPQVRRPAPEKAPRVQDDKPTMSPEELEKAAQTALVDSKYGDVVKLGTQLARSRPAVGWRLVVQAQCKQKSAAAARSYTRYVRAASSSSNFEGVKALLKSLCQGNGIELK